MGDEDFEIPVAPPDTDSSVKAGSKRTSNARSSRSSRASSSAAGEPRIKLCAYWTCDEDCKVGRRHCTHHNRHLDNARNQVAKQKGEEAAKAWVERCKDIEFANKQVAYMARKSIALPMFAHQPLIDFVEWEQEFGVLVQKKEAVDTEPYEEEQWIIEQVNKFGRNRQEMVNEWKQKIAGPWRRDNNGWKGALRLWLPAREYEEASTSKVCQRCQP